MGRLSVGIDQMIGELFDCSRSRSNCSGKWPDGELEVRYRSTGLGFGFSVFPLKSRMA